MNKFFEFKNIDHIAYIFNSLEDGYNFFQDHPGFELIKGPGLNKTQKVRYLFVSVHKIGLIEILSPYGNNSPIKKRLLESGPGLYHICYAVDDIKKTILNLTENWDWKITCSPISDVAFDGRKIAFLKSKKMGLIELVESKPNFFKQDHEISKNNQDNKELKNTSSISNKYIELVDIKEEKNSIPNEIHQIIISSIDDDEILPKNIKSFDDIQQWDSLAYAIFHASFESLVNDTLPLNENHDLKFYVEYFKNSMK